MPESTPTQSDAAWIDALKAGDPDAQRQLHTLIRSRLGRVLNSRRDVVEEDMDDFTQDACMRVLNAIDTFRGESQFTTWVMTIAVRVAMTALRRKNWPRDRVVKHLDDIPNHQIAAHDQQSLSAHELFIALRNAIETQLTNRQRQVIVGELAGIPQVVIAEHLDAKANAIYKVSHDARRKLRAALEDAGFDEESVRSILDRASKEVL